MLAADTEPVKCRGIPLWAPDRSCHGRLPRNHPAGWWTVSRLGLQGGAAKVKQECPRIRTSS